MTRTPFRLPDSFLLGTATAATQIEGGDRNNNWYAWYEAGNILDGSDPSVACDHWNRVEEDTELLSKLGCRVHRLGVEWSRIEPEEGRIDESAVEHYRRELAGIREAGVIPMVTMYHFSHPMWFERDGGWLSPRAGERFLRFAEVLVRRLGDLVDEWITINEPNVYLLFGHFMGEWPPGGKSLRDFFRGAKHIVRAHRAAYDMIHRVSAELGRETPSVGVAHHLRVFDPERGNPLDRAVASAYRRLTQDRFVRQMSSSRWSDFLGVNYYSRDLVRFTFDPPEGFGRRTVAPGAPVNDLGWERYPEGLYRVIRRYAEMTALPVYVTENGTCDANDSFRASYIYDHLYQLYRLLEDGVDVRRYYHWTLTDNFEWAEGNAARFGLVHVDYATQKRTVRDSGWFYADVCTRHSLSEDMLPGGA